MKKRSPQITFNNLGDVLDTVLKKRGMQVSSEKRRLQGIWFKAVGDRIAAHTSPEKIQKGTLFVKVSSSVWMQQLHFLKENIISKLNQQMNAPVVNDIHLSIGETKIFSANQKNPMSFFPENFPLNDKEKKRIEAYTISVSDQELKDILKRVMTKDIIRRKLMGTRKVP